MDMDLLMCMNKKCPKKDTCIRYIKETKDSFGQTYLLTEDFTEDGCDLYLT